MSGYTNYELIHVIHHVVDHYTVRRESKINENIVEMVVNG